MGVFAELPAVFRDGGRISAGNSSQVSEGAAAVLLMSRARADELGVKPRARVLDHRAVGVDPVLMLARPIPVTQRILERSRIKLPDIDLIEINEAFAPVIAAWESRLPVDRLYRRIVLVPPPWDTCSESVGFFGDVFPLGVLGQSGGLGVAHPGQPVGVDS
jgi:acetyl-CoA acetyltransferase